MVEISKMAENEVAQGLKMSVNDMDALAIFANKISRLADIRQRLYELEQNHIGFAREVDRLKSQLHSHQDDILFLLGIQMPKYGE
jgi:hypothetical protein